MEYVCITKVWLRDYDLRRAGSYLLEFMERVGRKHIKLKYKRDTILYDGYEQIDLSQYTKGFVIIINEDLIDGLDIPVSCFLEAVHYGICDYKEFYRWLDIHNISRESRGLKPLEEYPIDYFI